MLHRKEYKAIAEILKQGKWIENEGGSAYYDIRDKLADYFASDNPLFNRAKFIKACE